MSKRTSEVNKAISVVWTREQQLVQEGKGTRDWAPEQQQDILERGKAYDENGKAFEGHHMKSTEMYPEHQGNPQNIQFLSRPEHFKAHNGNFQNTTNGFYNYFTGDTLEFDMDIIELCAVVELTKPIVKAIDASQSYDNIIEESQREEIHGNIAVPIDDKLKYVSSVQSVNASKKMKDGFDGKIV